MNQRIAATMPAPVATVDAERALALARAVLRTEARAIEALAERLSDAFVAAVALMLDCRGRVVVSGIGKSGHIGHKLASTLASTGTPAFFVHPAEAGHGDLGMITPDDVVIMLSNSGETDELLLLAPPCLGRVELPRAAQLRSGGAHLQHEHPAASRRADAGV